MLNRAPLRVEMVLPTLVTAGMEMIVSQLTRGLANRGHNVGVTCIEAGGEIADALRADGHRVSVVASPGMRSNVYPAGLTRWFRRLRPDVVHVHSGAWLKGARAARLARVPHTIHTVHGIEGNEPWFTKALWQFAARYTDAIVSVSEPLIPFLAREMSLAQDKLRLIPNGVDTECFRPGVRKGRLRARLGLGGGDILVGNVARLTAIKDHALLLEAFALAHKQRPEATLAIVGDGPLRPHLERQIAALGLRSHARLVGAAADMPEVYREFDLFVLSSRFEGTSLSLLEAMASGVPVVATSVGGNPDLLGHGRFGVLVPPGDPAALASALLDLLRDETRRRSLAADARAHVVRDHGHAMMVRRYEELYYDLRSLPGEAIDAARGQIVCVD